MKRNLEEIKNSSFKENEVKQYENLLKLDFKKLLEELKKIINSFQPHSERKVPQKIDRFDVSLSCEASRRCGSTKDLVVCEDNRRKEYYVGCKDCLRGEYNSQPSVDELNDILEYTASVIKQPYESKFM